MGIYERKTDNKKKNVIITVLFSILLFIGIVMCTVCNMAISGRMTWSLIVISSIVFAWVVLFPSILLGTKGILASVVSLSIFIIPYLFLLSKLVKVTEVFSIGAVMPVISLVFIWIIVAILWRFGKEKRLLAIGIICVLAIPFMFAVNGILAQMINEPIMDVWDILSAFLLLILAFLCLACAYVRGKNK